MTTAPITPVDFKADFPEFGSVPDLGVQFYLDLAYNLLNSRRWPQTKSPNANRSLYDIGIELFTAHYLTVEMQSQQEALTGGIPGQIRGPISSEAGLGLSASYATTDTLYPNAGFWNMTSYGTRFYQLILLVGSGPLQIGHGFPPPLTGPAWPGAGWPALRGLSW